MARDADQRAPGPWHVVPRAVDGVCADQFVPLSSSPSGGVADWAGSGDGSALGVPRCGSLDADDGAADEASVSSAAAAVAAELVGGVGWSGVAPVCWLDAGVSVAR